MRIPLTVTRPAFLLLATVCLVSAGGEPRGQAAEGPEGRRQAASTQAGAAGAGGQRSGRPEVFPGAAWERVAPAAAGFSAAGLQAFGEEVKKFGTSAVVVVSGGRIVFEHGDTAQVSYLASARKSVLAMLFGNPVEKGTIRLDATLAELGITDHGGLSPRELEATVADLLAARSGVYHPASNGGDDLAEAPPRDSRWHGSYFLYNNWDFNALGTIFERQTGRDVYDALEADLARPIGMQDFRRDRQEKAGDLAVSMHPACHVYLSTRDMARVGYLMLRGGRWAGRQVVPAAWVRRMVTPVTRNGEMNPAAYRDGPFGFGLSWWVFDGRLAAGGYEGAYTAMGAGGQFITVLPALDLVIAHKVVMTAEAMPVSTGQYFTLVDALIAARTAPLPRVEENRTGVNALPAATASRIDGLVGAGMRQCRRLNLGVVRDGQVVFTRAYGEGRLAGEYEYASVSKPVTSTILMSLRRDRLIKSLDDDVRAYVPAYAGAMPEAYSASRLTLKHLLTHRGGIPHNDEPPLVGGRFNLKFEPGTRMLYSTPGYGILGRVIESATGLSFGDAVRRYVGEPVGAPSFKAGAGFIAPGAYVYSTIEDMARFAAGVVTDRYMPAEALYQEVLRPEAGSYGYGWGVANPGGEDVRAEHAGSNGLARAHILLEPRRRCGVVVLAEMRTLAPLDLDALARAVLGLLDAR